MVHHAEEAIVWQALQEMVMLKAAVQLQGFAVLEALQ